MTPWVIFLVVAGISLVGWAVSRAVRRGGNPGGEAGLGLMSRPDTGQAAGYYRSAQPAVHAETVPQVKMTLVGAKESGKTMQLLAMHHRMAIGEDGVRLRADERTFRVLGGLVSAIQGPNPVLPAGTMLAQADAWNFHVEARGWGGELRPIFRLSYYDYAGEHNPKAFEGISPEDGVPQEGAAVRAFQSAIRGHDVLLGVLDGGKICRAMDGQGPADLEQELWQTLALLSTGSQKIIHLVLTKWDEFTRHEIELREVVAHLDRYPVFRSLRSVRPPGRLRLIPVSAFGLNQYLTSTDIGLVKTPGEVWDPFHASLPIACGLTDIVAADLERIESAGVVRSKKFLSVATSPVFTSLLIGLGLTAATANPLHLMQAAVAGRQVGLSLQIPVGQIIDTLRGVIRLGNACEGDLPGHDVTRPLLGLPGRADQPAEKAATAHLLAYCVAQTRDLVREFPASDLTP